MTNSVEENKLRFIELLDLFYKNGDCRSFELPSK